MPIYKCDRCSKEFGQKCEYTRHINKKFPCEKSAANCSKPVAKCSKIEESDDNAIKCNYCGREFTRISSLNVHIKDRCKIKKANDNKMEEMMLMLIEIKEKMIKLEAENAKYKNIIQSGNIINGNQQIININLVPYGQEDLTKISDAEYQRILRRGFNSVPALVESLHFNKNFPENHNVYISNMRDDYVLMYDGVKWRLKNRDETLQQLYEDKTDILETKFEELIKRLDEQTIRMFQRFIKVKDDDDSVVCRIKKDLKIMLYENREMVKCTNNKKLHEEISEN